MSDIMNSLINGGFSQHKEPINLDKYISLESQLAGFKRFIDCKNFRYIMECKGVEDKNI